jgi:hypothetical protein
MCSVAPYYLYLIKISYTGKQRELHTEGPSLEPGLRSTVQYYPCCFFFFWNTQILLKGGKREGKLRGGR